MATIKAIEGRSIHQIQSGQVIVDLSSVVKELVENSLDAGAKSIEIRFKNHGLDSIEVQDNGKGISPEDFGTIALKHYTSKLSNYEDLASLDTFGFRGEALSSLCALSKFCILTARADDGAVGKKLDFEISGKLKGVSVAAAQTGTTVYVENLFYNLPVRRKELEKNIKREYGKVLNYLYAYACISVGVRFTVSNQMPKGKRTSVFSTKSNPTTKENITNIFGAKTLSALVRLSLDLEMEPSNGPATQIVRGQPTQNTDKSLKVGIEGHISRPVFGEGRQTPDRQMFFVNSRPCQLPQVSKAFNEVYKSFNVSQSPFVFANLIMDTNAYDVNVSPDKRTILLHDQTALLDRLRAALTEMFEDTDQTMPQSTLPDRKLHSFQPLTLSRQSSTSNGKNRSVAGIQMLGDDIVRDEETGNGRGSDDIVNQLETTSSTAEAPQSDLMHNWIEQGFMGRKEAPTKKRLGGVLELHNPKAAVLEQIDKNQPIFETALSTFYPELSTVRMSHGLKTTRELESAGTQPVDQETTNDPGLNASESDTSDSSYGDIASPRPDVGASGQRANRRASVTDEDDRDARGHTPPASDLFVEASNFVTDRPITAFAASSQKSIPGAVKNAFDRMRPKRTPLQTAQITIGDETTTAVIGSSPPYKKRRMHRPNGSQMLAESGGRSHHVRGLRESFAAPDSQLAINGIFVAPVRSTAARSISRRPKYHGGEGSSAGETSAEEDLEPTPLGSHSAESKEMAPAPTDDDDDDADYMDETEKKIQEDENIARIIQAAEESVKDPGQDVLRRVSQMLKRNSSRKDATLNLVTIMTSSLDDLRKNMTSRFEPAQLTTRDVETPARAIIKDEMDSAEAEKRLSLIVSKDDFERMHVIGQFNLGFILANRPAVDADQEDDLFIIDQHAADEKYNYERLQRTVTLHSQRLVRPKVLELTAFEQEIILNHAEALKANGFEVEFTDEVASTQASEKAPIELSRTFRLLTLPTSQQTTFGLSDLEELVHLLSEAASTTDSDHIPRPSKVQKMLAMRACRSSIMVGKTLTTKQMATVVRNMGEMEKPWNCPHGRPTMRHLARMDAWKGWQEGDPMDDLANLGGTDGDASANEDQLPFSWSKWINAQ